VSTPPVARLTLIANVYIDGFNLYYGCLKGTPYKWLDLEALAKRLLPKDQINRIRYFTARVDDRAGDPGAPRRQAVYLRALAMNPRISIHLGHFKTRTAWMPLARPLPGRPTSVEVLKTEEKGSDVNLATYLLLDAFRGSYEVAALVTNDSDLSEPIRVVAQELKLPAGVINPHPPHKRTTALRGTFYKQIRPAVLASCQLPPVLTDSRGRFTRPASW
jgi:NYN domain